MTAVNARDLLNAYGPNGKAAEKPTAGLGERADVLRRRLVLVGRLGVLGTDLLAEVEYTRKGDEYKARCRRIAQMALDAAVNVGLFLEWADANAWDLSKRRVVDDLVPALLDWDGNEGLSINERAMPTDTVTISPEAAAAYAAQRGNGDNVTGQPCV